MDKYKGTVGAPELAPMIGKSIKLTQRKLKIDAAAGFRDLELSQLQGIILALDWVADDMHHIWGSAVMVAPGVAITARHVVAEMRSKGFLEKEGGYLLALGFDETGLVIWNPDSFTPIGDGDLALLTLVRATAAPALPDGEPISINVATIAARAPQVNETISLFGCRASDAVVMRDDTIRVSLLGGAGPVLDVYPERRDQFLGPSACVDTKTVGGMSGGGAFDSDGRLVGIISTGIGEQPSFISFTWPCLCTPLKIGWPPGLVPEEATLSELAARGLCNVELLAHVFSHSADDGTPLVSLFSPQPSARSTPGDA